MQFRKSRATTFALFVLLLCAGSTVYAASATQGYWQDLPARPLPVGMAAPSAYRLLDLDANGLKARIAQGETKLALPTPGGAFIEFTLEDSATMPAELAARFPDIRSFRGKDSEGTHVRVDISPLGINAMVFAKSGIWMVRPITFGDNRDYISFNRADIAALRDPFQCEVHDLDIVRPSTPDEILTTTGTTKRNYRAAVAANHNYVQAISGANPPTVALGLAAVVIAVNRVNEVYENDLSIHLTLVANNNLLIFPDAATDPYQNGTGALGQNTGIINGLIGNANYDIGHVFTTGSGGVAGLGVVCSTSQKGRGTTGLGNPASLQSDTFYIDFVAHEMGHQFGGNHTFNNSCGGNRAAAAAYEPGSGSTIMGYAGVCPVDLQPHSDPYFHAKSLLEITTFTTGSGGACSVTAVNNSSPVVAPLSNYTIPASTPFALTGSASTTAPGATLKYGFEQYDLGAATVNLLVDPGNGPIIRSLNPTVSPIRTVPNFANLLSGGTMIGEILPSTTRALNFRLTVFDSVLGGGTSESRDMTLQVNNTAGPFAVSAPATGASWDYANGTGTRTVTWNVAGTNAAPVSCANVDIDIYNGGDFGNSAAMLALGVANSGSALVNVPNLATTTARVRVRCSNNIFFAMSPGNFTILGSDLIFADGFEFGVVPSNPPTVTKAFAPTSVQTDTASTLTITLANSNATPATLSSALTDTFPAGLVIAPAPNAATTCASGTVTALAGSGSVALSSGTQIPANGNCTVTVSVQSAAANSYANTIASGALQTDAGNNATAANATLTVTAPPLVPPTLSKAFAPTSVDTGVSSTLTITPANTNATTATLSSALTDTFPAGLVIAPAPNASTTCASGTVTAIAGSGSVSLSSGAQIPSTGSCTITVSVQSAVANSYPNSIPPGALQTDAGNNAASADATLTVTATVPVCSAQQIMDPGLETSDPSTGLNAFWGSTSTQGGSAICNSGCGASSQRSGDWWAWFGGYTSGTETATLTQSVTIQSGFDRTLKFWLRRLSTTNTTATMTVSLDGNVIGTYPRVAASEAAYVQQSIALPSAASDGNPHVVEFRFTKTGTGSTGSHFVDDITLDCTSGGRVAPTVVMSFAPTPVAANTPSTLTITLGNGNASTATLSAALVDTLPAGLVISPTPNASTTCPSATLTAAAGTDSISLGAGAQTPASGTCTINVDVQAATEANYANAIALGALQTNLGNNDYPARAALYVGNPVFTSGPIHHLIPNDGAGLEFDFETGVITDGYSGGLGDWNPYYVASGLTYFWEFTGNAGVATTATTSGKYVVLQSGATIGPSSVFNTNSGGCTGTTGNNSNFCAGVNGYLGFRFVGCSTSPSGTCYGYVHLTTTGTTGNPAYIEDYAYNKIGNAITIP